MVRPTAIVHLIDGNVDTAYFRAIARAHDRSQFPVTIGSLEPAGSLQSAMCALGTRSFALGAHRRSQYGAAVLRLAALLRRERFVILHAHCFDATIVGLFAARLAGAEFVFTRHHSDHHVRAGKRWHTRVDGWCARRARRVIAVSEATRRVMTEVEGVPRSRVRVIYNGMEPLRVPARETIAEVKQHLGIGEQHVILMPGRLHEEKGHRVLFEAVGEVRERLAPCVVLLAGDGPDRAALESEVRSRNLSDLVRFLGQRGDMPELLSLASVVVAPSLAESFGFVVLEAMSVGRPVVASATGGIPEIVGDSGAAILVRPNDPSALGAGIVEVLSNRERAVRMAEAGRGRATAFALKPMIRGYEDVYRDVLGERA